jgi:colicin import membrane protein
VASVDKHSFAGSDDGTPVWAAMMAVSFACHVAFFVMMHFLPALRPEPKRTLPPAVSVTMVSLPQAEAPRAASAKPAETPTARAQPAPPKPEEPPKPKMPSPEMPAPETPSAPKAKQSLKKQTYRSSKVVDSAISRIEETVAQASQQRTDPLKEALDRLREQVEGSQPAGPSDQPFQETEASSRTGLVGGSSEGILKELELIDIYRMEIAWRVQKNWAFPDRLAGNEDDLVVELAFTVLPNGEIRDVWFDKRSGNGYLDESAKRAVLKANPVGPFPKGVTKSVITVGLRFTPEGVK